jgi:hypothetical protein
MNLSKLQIGIAACLLFAATAGLLLQQKTTTELRDAKSALHQQAQDLENARAETERMREARQKADAEIARFRRSLDDTGSRATARPPSASGPVVHENGDPEKGMVAFEYYRNLGQATPAATFQTLVWAALNGDDHAAGATFALDAAAQTKASAVIAGLPKTLQARYPTPESLVALFVANDILKSTKAEVVNWKLLDSDHATLTVRLDQIANPGAYPQKTLSLQRTPGGWQFSASEKWIDGIKKNLAVVPTEGSAAANAK